MDQIGIMGGTYNPIHILHLLIGQLAREQHGLSKVLFIPSGDPPHKKAGLLDRESRFEMVAAGIASADGFEASRLEIDRPGITWSIDTLYELTDLYKGKVRLNFIIGDDNLPVLSGYDRREEFISLCRILICPRRYKNTFRRQRIFRKMVPGADMQFIDCPLFPISSTLIRQWIKLGRSTAFLVPPPVQAILDRKEHYKTQI
ncbi:MAG: nicotinate (nicotinamide) nucleotide adenylyltransferase [Candidatus Obscuribacterales bacterium]|nr:nicotinate (nicotinamide) nucleotide adenylyltransferase [Candidatus Obscuribacterales bacterium]